jgi:hypothetical protein
MLHNGQHNCANRTIYFLLDTTMYYSNHVLHVSACKKRTQLCIIQIMYYMFRLVKKHHRIACVSKVLALQ